ncbi:MAG: hypothetical protein ACOYBV_02245 [Candidatus Avilachnospira sp.]
MRIKFKVVRKMDLSNLNELKNSIEGLVKNVKSEDIEKIKDMVKDGVDTEDVKEIIKTGMENVDGIKEDIEDLTEKIPEMDGIKEQLGKLEGLKDLLGGGKDK